MCKLADADPKIYTFSSDESFESGPQDPENPPYKKSSSTSSTWFSFHECDHIKSSTGLKQSVSDLVNKKLPHIQIKKIYLLTQLRHFNYVFNPLCVYYVFDDQDEFSAYVLEVSNTPWHEKHHYVIAKTDDLQTQKKSFHVSPFLDMDYQYIMHVTKPDHKLHISICNKKGENVHFSAKLTLTRSPFDQQHFSRLIKRYYLITWLITLRIYYHGIKLWLKKTPFFTHPKKR